MLLHFKQIVLLAGEVLLKENRNPYPGRKKERSLSQKQESKVVSIERKKSWEEKSTLLKKKKKAVLMPDQ